MTNWTAITESGAVYKLDGTHLSIDSKRSGFISFSVPGIKVVNRQDDLPDDVITLGDLHNYLHTLPYVDVPEVGKSIYAAGIHQWRLSNPVVSLEITE